MGCSAAAAVGMQEDIRTIPTTSLQGAEDRGAGYQVEGVGIMRHLNDWQILRLRKMSKGRNHNIAPMAFGLDMTIQQFKPLAPEQKRLAWHAPHSAPGTPGGRGAQPAGTAATRPWSASPRRE
jgi:hypothetical protein